MSEKVRYSEHSESRVGGDPHGLRNRKFWCSALADGKGLKRGKEVEEEKDGGGMEEERERGKRVISTSRGVTKHF
jgi:hypothetical protein